MVFTLVACDDDKAELVPFETASLESLIVEAEDLINNNEEGTRQGLYRPGSKKELQDVLTWAKLKIENAKDEVGCLTNFVNLNKDAIGAGNRFALSAEYTRRDKYGYDDPNVMLNEEKQSSLVAKLTYARNLGFGNKLFGVGSKSRFDLSASYDDVSSDPMRHDRAIANATLAQELSNGLFLTISLGWSNKPEFRVNPDEELSVMAGISYKLPGME